MAERWTILIILIILSAVDLRWQMLPSWMILAAAAGGFCCTSATGWGKAEWILWMVTSVGVLIICRLTRQSLGYGDGMMWSVTALYLGMEKNTEVWITAFFLACSFSVVALLARKVRGDTRVPFLPFLTAAHGILLFLERGR
ncbi:MAG: prepilin peptidase [Lachnospiraceae bacterium]|nr:prepilin peptidase [Robinsoniella sp.]MDY3766984.1 prepilin peptidase [Lachnospiraceae bacterium]